MRSNVADVAERWIDGLPDAPGGVIGAWINVILGAGLAVGLPIIAFTSAEAPANIFFAIAALALAGFLEATFVYKLRQQLARRRARARVAAPQAHDDSKQPSAGS